jgi:hypothetical protein
MVVKNLSWILAVVAVSAVSAGAAAPCSIHPAKGMSDSQLEGLAKLSRTDAEKIALSRVKSQAAVSVVSGELEAERGCLIWSFDLKVAGKPGIQEIQVDAGDGKVLSVKQETSQQEAAEAKKEAAKTSK